MTTPWPYRIATVLAACREAGLPDADRDHALRLLERWQRPDEALAWVVRWRDERDTMAWRWCHRWRYLPYRASGAIRAGGRGFVSWGWLEQRNASRHA